MISYLLEFTFSSEQLIMESNDFFLYSLPCSASSSTFMDEPSQQPSKKPHTSTVVPNSSNKQQEKKEQQYLQTRVQKPWIKKITFVLNNFLIVP